VNVPILGQGGTGRAPMHTIPQTHAAELRTADGGVHRLEFEFGVPIGDGGAADLRALGGFDAEAQTNANIANMIHKARTDPAAVSVPAADGTHVVIVQIASWRYLGPVEDTEGGQP
jgi:hypothetical protein